MTLYKIATYKYRCMEYHRDGTTFLNPESIRDILVLDSDKHNGEFCSVSFLNTDDYYFCKLKDIEKIVEIK